jgi:nucleotide-binding universal stress UspA family protein
MTKPTSAIADMHVVVDLAGERPAATVAAALARRLDAHLTGIVPAFEPLIPIYPTTAMVATDIIAVARESALKEAKSAAAAFEAIAKRVGIGFERRIFETIAGEGFAEMVETCRLSDLVVVGQDNPDQPESFRPALIEALLFDAAAPTLVVPYTGVDELKFERVIVAWDGGVQAARALRAALPLISGAKAITVVIVAEESKWAAGVPGADIADHLARHGLRVEVQRLDNPLHDVSAMLLNTAAEMDADWMVMGAYGHSRVRQMLLGGVTRGILRTATVPVLLAH